MKYLTLNKFIWRCWWFI